MTDDVIGVRYWPFAILCALVLAAVLMLLLRARITLQGSMSYSLFLGVFLAAALAPSVASKVAHWMGFSVLSNFLFSLALIGLSLLHLRSLITHSRTERRTIRLTQELALLEERMKRLKDGADS